MTAKIISGNEIAKEIREELKQEIAGLKEKHGVVPFAVPKLVETEQGVVADTLKMTVVGCSFLLPIYRTFRAVHVQYHSLVGCLRHGLAHPLTIQLLQTPQVLPGDEDIGLKPA